MSQADRIAILDLAARVARRWLARDSRLDARALEFQAVLDLHTLECIEREQRVVLPEQYREFLLEVGNGGGPAGIYDARTGAFEGLYPLPTDLLPGFLSRPCPLEPDWTITASSDASDNDPDAFAGTVTLQQSGCGWVDVLVVSGPSRGKVLSTDGATCPSQPALSFYDWYVTYLEACLR